MAGKRFVAAIAAAVAIGAVADGAWAQRRGDFGQRLDRWEELGCVEVGRRAEYDVIKVPRHEGRFTALRLEARNGDLDIEELRVVYGNGQPDRLPVAERLPEGRITAPIDLEGRERLIDRIEIVSRVERNRDDRRSGERRRRGTLCVSAIAENRRFVAPRPPVPPLPPGIAPPALRPGDDYLGRWEQLGCQSVGFRVDRDVIRVGRQEGRFSAIRLDVSNNDIYVIDLRVIYANGEIDDIPVRERIRRGGRTQPLDLRGDRRAIDRIELVYRAQLSLRGSAQVCAYGLEGRGRP